MNIDILRYPIRGTPGTLADPGGEGIQIDSTCTPDPGLFANHEGVW